MLSKLTNSEEETVEFGRKFAQQLNCGDIVALYGELGSGKTRFIKGICLGLGVHEHVASPTFTIVNEYKGDDLTVYHFDFYRMKSIDELREIGFEEYVNGEGVCLIEWADKVESLLPSRRFDVRLALGKNRDSRKITIDEVVEVSREYSRH